ncbi:hypothetical protein EG359_17450 [Chryseobacterium joostei]|uniref:Uncharacterized protein n=1 Tax=Chryseobacterium joostei TaxID=112234 RepID=A0A1N7IB39_9FLAO|nr:hypothetical protein [Chryseobacterium joostei]AZB01290.1 hypothetical protein EG359_17450 [Chryseobacterium joostei]SIS34301.1 hypothetical protein SAMN05421768_103691 [Chryseobacterium joostei]
MLKIKKCSVADMVARVGGLFCDEEQITGIILADRKVRFDPSTFTKTILDDFIQKDSIIGTLKFFSAEDADVDPTFTDSPIGESTKQNLGIKKWNLTFNKGNCFQNELQKLDKSERYSIFLVFTDGSILGQYMNDGKIKGFNVRLFTGIKKVKTAAEGGGSTLRVDLMADAMKYWQGKSALVESEEIDFTELNPVAGVSVDIVSPLIAAGTKTKVRVSNMCANSPVTGLTAPLNWKLKRNGSLESITAISEINGEYEFTHAALLANDKVSFEINEGGYPVYILDTDYYAGKSIEEKVSA